MPRSIIHFARMGLLTAGLLMAVQVQGDGATWWRLGKVRYRWAPAGRR